MVVSAGTIIGTSFQTKSCCGLDTSSSEVLKSPSILSSFYNTISQPFRKKKKNNYVFTSIISYLTDSLINIKTCSRKNETEKKGTKSMRSLLIVNNLQQLHDRKINKIMQIFKSLELLAYIKRLQERINEIIYYTSKSISD